MSSPLDLRKVQSPAVRIVNGVATRWRKAISMDPEYLMEKARRRSGLADFGGADFREGLAVLAHSMDRELPLHFTGRLLMQRELLHCLERRLKITDYFQRHPETENVKVPDPVIIVGMPRTGTTFLQRLLAQDSRTRTLRAWEMHDPAPPASGVPDRRFEKFRYGQWRYRKVLLSAVGHETARAIHYSEAADPEECHVLLQTCFRSGIFILRAYGSEYAEWLDKQDFTEAYRYYRKQLQLLTSQRPAERLVVKHPGHLRRLDEIFAVFPGAKIVWMHRNPVEVVPSWCSLWTSSLTLRTNAIEPERLGPIALNALARIIAKAMEARARHPEDQFLDVYYRDLIGEPAGTARRIYEFLGWPWEREWEELLTNWLAQDREARRGIGHRYSADEFGLTTDEIRLAFRSYTERFSRTADKSSPEERGTRLEAASASASPAA